MKMCIICERDVAIASQIERVAATYLTYQLSEIVTRKDGSIRTAYNAPIRYICNSCGGSNRVNWMYLNVPKGEGT